MQEPQGDGTRLFRRVKDLVMRAWSIPADKRIGFVEAETPGEPEVRQQVLDLLREGSDLPTPRAAAAGSVVRAWPEEIGRYRLLERLGEGGMGLVYLAEQREPVRRRVALKIIRPGMDTERFLARFEAERQAMAMMEHSSIARVLDAGKTESGQPFLAMEYVKGIPITAYCDEHKLDIGGRLRLFIDVCSAIQHAHTKGVMHRDLKPSNILVAEQDGRALPKVIDFGLAKAVDHRLVDATVFTEHGQLLGTLEYMSPEQAGVGGLDIDMRTDVYSLGVLLYQLLTGTLPLSRQDLMKHDLGEMQRLIKEGELAKPSTRITTLGESAENTAKSRRIALGDLRRKLRGELDWIVMKALEKDRTRRYMTVAEFASDLERFLRQEPVSAGPPSTAYLLRKSLQRHRGVVMAGGLVFIALGIGLLVAMKQAERAEAARTEVDRQKQAIESKEQSLQLLLAQYRQLADGEQLNQFELRVATLGGESPLFRAKLADWLREVDAWWGSMADHEAALRKMSLRAQLLGSQLGMLDIEEQFLFRALQDLVGRLRSFGEIHNPTGRPRVAAALEWANKVESETCGAYAEQWRVCKSEVAGHKDFAGLDLKPQLGLVPLGADPKTGLQEFWFMRSGDRPQRGPDGRYELKEGTGMVFVLLPGGSFTMGDAAGLPNERPPHQVHLGPFFLSKYEMTQAQWERWTGQNPSQWKEPSRPIVSISYNEVMRELQWRGLTLPTEAQWEFACRAGTTTRWFYGNQRESLLGESGESLVNIASGGVPEAKFWPGYSDRYEVYAPVGVFPANAFGLHEMHGNVAELCRGPAVGDYAQARHSTGDGLLAGDSMKVVQRGGSWYKPDEDARCAYRIFIEPTEHMGSTGVRPARAIDP